MFLEVRQNEYGKPVDTYRCDTCGEEFTVCPAHADRSCDDQWTGCLAPECASYDPARDADKWFDEGRVRAIPVSEGVSRWEVAMSNAERIAGALTPMQVEALKKCCERGSTRGNDGGLIDDLLSGLCSNTAEGVYNGWLVKWSMNPNSRSDGYINLYEPTPLGLEVKRILEEKE